MFFLYGFLFKRRKKLTELRCVRFSWGRGQIAQARVSSPGGVGGGGGASCPGHSIFSPTPSCLEKNGLIVQ